MMTMLSFAPTIKGPATTGHDDRRSALLQLKDLEAQRSRDLPILDAKIAEARRQCIHANTIAAAARGTLNHVECEKAVLVSELDRLTGLATAILRATAAPVIDEWIQAMRREASTLHSKKISTSRRYGNLNPWTLKKPVQVYSTAPSAGRRIQALNQVIECADGLRYKDLPTEALAAELQALYDALPPAGVEELISGVE